MGGVHPEASRGIGGGVTMSDLKEINEIVTESNDGMCRHLLILQPDGIMECPNCGLRIRNYDPFAPSFDQFILRMRVWHIPQVPGKPFYVPVDNEREAATVVKALADYDLFLLENGHRVDYANGQGLQYFDRLEDDWFDWEDAEGRLITEFVDAEGDG